MEFGRSTRFRVTKAIDRKVWLTRVCAILEKSIVRLLSIEWGEKRSRRVCTYECTFRFGRKRVYTSSSLDELVVYEDERECMYDSAVE